LRQGKKITRAYGNDRGRIKKVTENLSEALAAAGGGEVDREKGTLRGNIDKERLGWRGFSGADKMAHKQI